MNSWLMVAFMGVTAVMAVISFLHSVSVTRTRASKKELDDLRAEDARLRGFVDAEVGLLQTALVAHAERLATLEAQVAAMPNTAAIKGITDSIGALNGNVERMAGGFESLKEQVGRITDFLMKGPK